MGSSSQTIGVGQLAQDLREAAGLSQDEIAARAGVSQRFVSYIERSERKASTEVWRRIATALGVSPELFEQTQEAR